MIIFVFGLCGFVFDDEGCCILSELSAGAGVIECDVCDVVVVCFDFWLFWCFLDGGDAIVLLI